MLNRFLPTTYPSTCYTCRQPTLDEVRIAIQKLRHGRVAGLDGLPPELIKCALLTYIWSSGKVPAEWKSDIILALYQGKGPRNECSRHRPITLLSVRSQQGICSHPTRTIESTTGILPLATAIWIHQRQIHNGCYIGS